MPILELMNCNVGVEEDDPIMQITADSIGEQWPKVFRSLHIQQVKIKRIEQEFFQSGIGEIIYQLLESWRQSSKQLPTIGVLSTALWKNECYECVTKLKNYYKKNIKAKANDANKNADKDSDTVDEEE